MIESYKTTVLPFIKEFYWIIRPIILLIVWRCADMALQKLIERFYNATTNRIQTRVKNMVTQRVMLQRVSTLYQLASQLLRGVLAFVMFFYLLSLFGIDMLPVIAGVGIAGLALSLAVQNIVRDYLTGFLILFEDQFNVGDYISAGGYSGTVESFSLRSTRLRDLSGSLTIIPNSAIQAVQNYNKSWAAAIIDIGISYESDYKKALDIAAEIARNLASDPSNGIIETPTTQGIVTFSDNAVMLRAIIKTYPGQQWVVGRTYRQMLKQAYDENGIVLAYPRLFVHTTSDAANGQQPTNLT